MNVADEETADGTSVTSTSQFFDQWTASRERPFSTGEALWWERLLVRSREQPNRSPDQIAAIIASGLPAFHAEAERHRTTALCLSGGGIRSAAFSLGVVQSFAAKGLLTSFDYLSTVSGGGYLGGFLQRWALGDPADGRDEAGLEQALAASIAGGHVPEIDRLRDGATFVTPRLGMFSDDTWTVVATWLRNLSVIWLLFAPIFVLAAAVPLAVYWLLMGVSSREVWIALGIHLLALVWAMAAVGVGMPTYRRLGYLPPGRIGLHVCSTFLLAGLSTLVVCSGPPVVAAPWGDAEQWRMWPAAASAALAVPSGLLIAAAVAVFANRKASATSTGSAGHAPLATGRILWDVPLFTLCGLAGSMAYLAASVMVLGSGRVFLTEGGVEGLEYILVLGPAVFLAAVLVAGWLFALLRTAGRRSPAIKADLDREWLTRLSAVLSKPVAGWMFFSFVSVFVVFGGEVGAVGEVLRPPPLTAGQGAWVVPGGVASGAIAALAGRSGATGWVGYAKRLVTLELVVAIATLAFALLALAAAGAVAGELAFRIQPLLAYAVGVGNASLPVLAHATLIGALLLFVAVYGRLVDVNRFSLNGFYRNRLARAFLGAARVGGSVAGGGRLDERDPDPFTGFDPRDNVRLHTLLPVARVAGGRPALFPVINVALNAVATRRLAWQERKALPFVLTPLACGSGWLDVGADGGPAGAYVPAHRYGGLERDLALEGQGVTLAAAMAVSGAAASPSMGYHSSPATAFLMTLFNVRLGAWLPNPLLWRGGSGNPIERARNAVGLILRELTGRTADDTPDVYLSDGGHFENLGLYEMVRRRCAHIVCVDGGCDPGFGFADLGNAIRKVSIDLGVEITFERFGIRRAGSVAHACGSIAYPAVPGLAPAWVGRILYVKPGLVGDLPLDVQAYAAGRAGFPHESTADQWYSESQFESYRSLGQHLADALGRHSYTEDAKDVALPEGPSRLAAFIEDVARTSAVKAETSGHSEGGLPVTAPIGS